MKISKSLEGGYFEIGGLLQAHTTLGQPVHVIVITAEEFQRLVTLGAELLLSAPECTFIQG